MSETRAQQAQQAQQALSKALDFLAANQKPDGEIPLYITPDPTMQRHCLPDSVTFGTIATALHLSRVDDPRARQIIQQAQAYLAKEMLPFGIWGWWGSGSTNQAVPDTEDTALASIVIKDHPVVRSGFNRGLLLARRNEDGLFWTELVRTNGSLNIIDSICNVNVPWYLGNCPEIEPAINFVNNLILTDHPDVRSVWYPHKFMTYYAIARAYRHGITGLGRSRAVILEKTVESQQPDGCFGDELVTAHGICILIDFDYEDRTVIDRAVNWLIDRQQPNGAWAKIWASTWPDVTWMPTVQIHPDAPPGTAIYWGSEELTTAGVIEALAAVCNL